MVRNRMTVDRSLKRHRGVGILEVLIALVVVSFGVLGMAGLQLTGMKHSNGGYNRAKAVLFAENIAARMRANPVGVAAGDYAGYDSDTDADCDTKPVPYCQAYQGVAAASCSASEMAVFDLFSIACGNWSAANTAEDGVLDGLFESQLQVNCVGVCSAASNYTVLITWDENSGVDDNESTASSKRVQVRFKP